MLGISLQDRIGDEEICKRTRVTDSAYIIPTFNSDQGTLLVEQVADEAEDFSIGAYRNTQYRQTTHKINRWRNEGWKISCGDLCGRFMSKRLKWLWKEWTSDNHY